MSAYFYKRDGGLFPADEEGKRGMGRLEDGECVMLSVIRPRNVQWHRMYYGICTAIGQNQDPPRDKDSIDHELRILAGHFDVMQVNEYEIRVPKRLAFEKLSADGWANLWPSLELAIREKFGEEYLDQSTR